ncbi:MAG: hypothetical protein AAFQ75_07120 [Pseudomonadota bacterium]
MRSLLPLTVMNLLRPGAAQAIPVTSSRALVEAFTLPAAPAGRIDVVSATLVFGGDGIARGDRLGVRLETEEGDEVFSTVIDNRDARSGSPETGLLREFSLSVDPAHCAGVAYRYVLEAISGSFMVTSLEFAFFETKGPRAVAECDCPDDGNAGLIVPAIVWGGPEAIGNAQPAPLGLSLIGIGGLGMPATRSRRHGSI